MPPDRNDGTERNLASVGLNATGQFLQAGNELVVVQPEIDARSGFHGATADDHGSGAALGNVFIKIDTPAAVGRAVFIPEPCGLARLDESVLQYALRRNGYGGEQLGMFHGLFLF